MARSVLLLVLVVVTTCVLLTQDVDAGKKKWGKMAKKSMKRRMPIIVRELENNVTALWEEVRQLGQPVHVHLHGDSHLMDPDHPHHHHHHQHDEHHSQDKDKPPEDDDDDDDGNADKENDKKEGKHPHVHQKSHGDEGEKKKKSDNDSEDEDMMMKKKHKHGCPHCMKHRPQEGEEEEEGWEEKWMHGGRRATHVHIHLHTGKEEEEAGSRHHHAESPLPQVYHYARCNVAGNRALPFAERQDIKGTIYFRQMPEQPLEVKGDMKGFLIKRHGHDQPGQHQHLRGLHGHEFGDLSNSCNSLGGHLNPSGVPHGGPEAEHRHVGDFGNIEVKEDGTAMTSFTDDVASIFGTNSMLGRSLVIHAGPDDLGHGESESSRASGSAGKRIACCVIVACSEPAGVWPSEGN